MSGCLNKLIPKMILIIVALLLVAAVGGAITETVIKTHLIRPWRNCLLQARFQRYFAIL